MRKNYDIRKKRERLAEKDYEYFHSTSNFSKPSQRDKKDSCSSSHEKRENSEYFQNSLKNKLEYDKEAWFQRNQTPHSKNWKHPQETQFSLDFRQLIKTNPDSSTSHSFRKNKRSITSLMKPEVVSLFKQPKNIKKRRGFA